ncbi:MAG: hypothetical protein ACREAK_00200 [Nitrosarchaeum sp.]
MKGLVFFVGILSLVIISPVYAHQSGCHRWHSCLSDTGSYVCGDTGYCSQCPDNQYCKSGMPRVGEYQSPNQSHIVSDKKIPDWIMTSVFQWSQDLVTDSEFISSMEYLIDNRILNVSAGLLEEIPQYRLPEYQKNIDVPISGKVSEFRKGAYVDLVVVKPDGIEISSRAIVAQILNDDADRGSYYTLVKISHDDPIGTYNIIGKYLGQSVSVSEFKIVEEYEIIKNQEVKPIPTWIKNTVEWWWRNLISEDDFLYAIQFLINEGIISV